MGSQVGDADSTQPVPLKYARASDISTEDFLAAARRAGGGNAFVHLWEIAWELSDYERPKKLAAAPDVSENAVQSKATQLDLRGEIRHAKDTLYFIPRAPDEGGSDPATPAN